jgi:GxxExxY protein
LIKNCRTKAAKGAKENKPFPLLPTSRPSRDPKNKMNDSDIERTGKAVLDAAFHVHSVLGPGLLESVYEAALFVELKKRALPVERQVPIAASYEGEQLEVGFRADLIVKNQVLVELKSVEAVTPLFQKITTNYLKLVPLKLGYLINFNEIHLKDGLTRLVNGLEGKTFFPPSQPSRSSRDT